MEQKRFTRATWQIMEQLLEVDSLEDALTGSLEIIIDALECEAGAVWLLDPKKDRLSPVCHMGPADISGISIENGLGVEGLVTKTGKSVMVTDAVSDPRIDGTVFDSTEGGQLPALFMVGDLIMGWQIVLTRMHEGDKWEVYIPAKWGYGATKMDDIPAHSTLIFELKLVKIER